GALEPEDCATLRFLAAATRERPVILVLDERDARTGGYAEPVPLAELLTVMIPPIGSQELSVRCARVSLPSDPAPATATATELEPTSATATEPALAPAPTSEPEPEPEPADRNTAGASVVDREEAWRAWTLQLVAARGPQPLASLERLFTDSYMPLANAVGAGLDDARARGAADEFRATFSKSYAEAFPTFSATTKRPRM